MKKNRKSTLSKNSLLFNYNKIDSTENSNSDILLDILSISDVLYAITSKMNDLDQFAVLISLMFTHKKLYTSVSNVINKLDLHYIPQDWSNLSNEYFADAAFVIHKTYVYFTLKIECAIFRNEVTLLLYNKFYRNILCKLVEKKNNVINKHNVSLIKQINTRFIQSLICLKKNKIEFYNNIIQYLYRLKIPYSKSTLTKYLLFKLPLRECSIIQKQLDLMYLKHFLTSLRIKPYLAVIKFLCKVDHVISANGKKFMTIFKYANSIGSSIEYSNLYTKVDALNICNALRKTVEEILSYYDSVSVVGILTELFKLVKSLKCKCEYLNLFLLDYDQELLEDEFDEITFSKFCLFYGIKNKPNKSNKINKFKKAYNNVVFPLNPQLDHIEISSRKHNYKYKNIFNLSYDNSTTSYLIKDNRSMKKNNMKKKKNKRNNKLEKNNKNE